MVMKRVFVSLLAVAVAATAIICALMLASQEAKASLVAVKTCSGDTIKLNGSEKRMLELHNRARAHRGLKALCVSRALTEAARAHSQNMLNRDYAAHTSPDGETVKQRLKRFGYGFSDRSYYAYGENIAWGCGSYGAPERIFRWWMHSSGHRSNILKKDFRQVGIGAHHGTFKTCKQATTYTVDFGVRRR